MKVVIAKNQLQFLEYITKNHLYVTGIRDTLNNTIAEYRDNSKFCLWWNFELYGEIPEGLTVVDLTAPITSKKKNRKKK